MGRLFGTDGVRGVANVELDIHLATKIGQAVGLVMGREKGSAPVVAIGKDTRLSVVFSKSGNNISLSGIPHPF